MEGFLGTKADFWWDVTVTTETLVMLSLVLGYYYARKHQGLRHQYTMLIGSVLVLGWLLMYFAQQAIAGIIGFGGPDQIRYLIYVPLIIFHSLVSTAAVILAVIQLYNGFKTSQLVQGKRVLVHKPHIHRRMGVVTLICFLLSVITAYLIYAMLFILYEPARTPEYSASESWGILSMIGLLVFLLLGGVFYLLGRRRPGAQTTPSG